MKYLPLGLFAFILLLPTCLSQGKNPPPAFKQTFPSKNPPPALKQTIPSKNPPPALSKAPPTTSNGKNTVPLSTTSTTTTSTTTYKSSTTSSPLTNTPSSTSSTGTTNPTTSSSTASTSSASNKIASSTLSTDITASSTMPTDMTTSSTMSTDMTTSKMASSSTAGSSTMATDMTTSNMAFSSTAGSSTISTGMTTSNMASSSTAGSSTMATDMTTSNMASSSTAESSSMSTDMTTSNMASSSTDFSTMPTTSNMASTTGTSSKAPSATPSSMESSTAAPPTSPTNSSTPPCSTNSARPCVFPFSYGGVTYSTCTSVDDTQPWCATSLYSNGEALEFGYCSTSCEISTPSVSPPSTCQTNQGQACQFPFIYNERNYSGCTDADNNGVAWCATTLYPNGEARDYDVCSSSCPVITTTQPPTVCETINKEKCIFPFIYNGQTFTTCTTADNGNVPWCATRLNGDKTYANYGVCSSSSCDGVSSTSPISISTKSCITNSGEPCLFPFLYNGNTYTNCTDVEDNRLWCATSLLGGGEVDGYGYCSEYCLDGASTLKPNACLTTSEDLCVFPFNYLGETYNTCTTKDNNGLLWCATSLKSDREYNDYGLCSSSCQ